MSLFVPHAAIGKPFDLIKYNGTTPNILLCLAYSLTCIPIYFKENAVVIVSEG